MNKTLRTKIEKLFTDLNKKLLKLDLEIDNHAEFVSLLKSVSTGETKAFLYENNEIDWDINKEGNK